MNSTLTALLNAALNGAIVSVPLAGLIWLGLRLTSRRILGAAARYVIWWVALAVTVALPVAFFPERLHPSAVAPRAVSVELGSSPMAVIRATSIPPAMATTIARTAPSRRRFSLQITAGPWIRWISAAWALAASLLLLRLVVSCVLLAGFKSRAHVIPVAAPASTRRNVRVAVSQEVSAPMAAGFLRPTILIPARLVRELDASELDFIGLHESAHFARRDDYALIFERLIEALFALHPIVRWIARQIDLEREIACDDRVVEVTGRSHPYAACLTRVAELTAGAHASFAAAAAAREGSHLTRRVEMLLDKARRSGTRWIKTRLACALAIVCALAYMAAHAPALLAFTTPPAPTIHPPQPPPNPRVTATTPIPRSIAQAAPPQTPVPERPPIAVPTAAPAIPMVLEPVQVRDPQGRLVTGLAQENFRVFEDGAEQRISSFTTTNVPALVGVVSQNPDGLTLPMQEELVQLQQITPLKIEFIEKANPQLTFRDTATAAMNRIREVQSSTTHRVILVLDAQLDFPVVFTTTEGGVTLIGVTPGVNNSMQTVASYLQANDYVLGYTPTNLSADGKYRRIQVKLSSVQGLPPLRVEYRTGYYDSTPGACRPQLGLPPNATCY